MSLTASIIEQRVAKLVDEFREQLSPGDDAMLRSRAFVLLTTSVVLDLSPSQALALVTDGGHDLAIDALHVGDIVDAEFVVTIVQGKYRRRHGAAFPANDIHKVIHTVAMLFDPDLDLPPAHLHLLARVEEIRSLVRDGNLPMVRVILCNNGERWRPDADALIADARLPEQQVSWEHVNHDHLVGLMQRPKAVDDELHLSGAAVVEDFDFCRVLIGKVCVRELARLVSTHGDRLLERNIRRYLGLRNNRVNQGIAHTLRSPDRRNNFYFFNNGITLTCSKFRHNALQASNYRVRIEDLQVINGGQTCHTVWRTLAQMGDLGPDDFDQTFVLVRIYELDQQQRGLVHDITYATNSQNPVDLRDLRANDEIQARLQLGLADLGYDYLRKREQSSSKQETISPTEAAEAVLTVLRRKPHLARFHRHQFFGRLYPEIFSDTLTPTEVVEAVRLLRAARSLGADLSDPPRHLPYTQHLVAMLMADEPCAATDIERAYRRALLRVKALLALCGVDERSASLQRLSSVFRRGELASRARTLDAEGTKITTRVRGLLQQRDQIFEDADQALSRARALMERVRAAEGDDDELALFRAHRAQIDLWLAKSERSRMLAMGQTTGIPPLHERVAEAMTALQLDEAAP